MAEALRLAWLGQGKVEPNPMVGCVLVKNARRVGRGYHHRFGGPHAEIAALRQAGSRARGSTAFVTLEPCGHFGKTPPCTDALIAAGVRRVVAAIKDPNPVVAGRGFAMLRAAGIRCEVGLGRDAAEAQNAPFITYHVKKRPYVILKWAQSIDGKIATRAGRSKWISSIESRAAVHALRGRVDGIIVGAGTVLADDPELTCRGSRPLRIATRIVLDPHLKTPLSSKLVRAARQTPTMLVTLRRRRAFGKRKALHQAGCILHDMAGDRIRLKTLLRDLRRRGMTNLLVEGGGIVLGAFVQQRVADEARIFVAPMLIGGEAAPGPLRNIGPATLKDAPRVDWIETLHFGRDLCYTLRFR